AELHMEDDSSRSGSEHWPPARRCRQSRLPCRSKRPYPSISNRRIWKRRAKRMWSDHTFVVNPCAILISVPWFTVHEILCVTASTNPAADGCPLPLFLTPPNGRCTSAPMHGRLT